jgi:hypothetical protein
MDVTVDENNYVHIKDEKFAGPRHFIPYFGDPLFAVGQVTISLTLLSYVRTFQELWSML